MSGVCATVTPAATASTEMKRANTWARGRNMMVRACSWTILLSEVASAFSESSTKLPWVSSQPLGRPVVPEV